MMTRKFNYNDVDGNHWPDADVGDDLYYSVDFSCWLDQEFDVLLEAVWLIPDGLTSTDEYTQDKSAVIKLKSLRRGSFKCVCTLKSQNFDKIQSNVIPMILKVV